MGTSPTESDLALLHRKGAALTQRMRAEDRILQYIFQNPNEETLLVRLGEVLTTLDLIYRANKATWATSKSFIRKICHQLEQRKMLHRLMLKNHAADTSPKDQAGKAASPVGAWLQPQDSIWYGWQSLMTEMYRYVGETGERSVQFALWLFEEVLPLLKQFSRWREAKKLEEIASHEELVRAGTAITVMLNAARSPPHPDAVMKDWLARLIEEADQNHSTDEVLGSVIDMLTIGTTDNKLFVAGHKPERLTELFLACATTNPDPTNPVLILSERHLKMFAGYEERTLRKREADQKRGKEVLERFIARREEIDNAVARKCEEMSRGLRRGLRPDGVDYIEITVGPLFHAGVRAIIFHPEGRTYPNVGVEILVRKETPHLISFMLELDFSDTPEAESRMQDWVDGMHDALWNLMYPIEELAELLSCIIIDAMHRIVLPGTRPLREPRNDDNKGRKKGAGTQAAVSVRPFIRPLPPTHKASDEATARAVEALGYRLPPGVTFVGAFYRGKKLGYHLPEPFAGYSDDDVLHFLG